MLDLKLWLSGRLQTCPTTILRPNQQAGKRTDADLTQRIKESVTGIP
jgi:hypothetical protein